MYNKYFITKNDSSIGFIHVNEETGYVTGGTENLKWMRGIQWPTVQAKIKAKPGFDFKLATD